jgi:hypothetical protein
LASQIPTEAMLERALGPSGALEEYLIHSHPASLVALVAGTAMKTGPSEKLAGHFISKYRLLPFGRPRPPPFSSNEFHAGRL